MRSTLAEIFDAFSGGAAFEKLGFRKEYFSKLHEQTIDSLLQKLNLASSAPSFESKVQKLVSLGWKSNDDCRKICALLGIGQDLLPEGKSQVAPIERLSKPDSYFKSLKEYQVSIVSQARARLAIPRSRFIIQMPTGSGKTRTAMELVCEALNDHPKGTCIVWLAHSEELCVQAHAAFKELWAHLGRQDVDVVRVWGDADGLDGLSKEVSAFVIGGFPKLSSLATADESKLKSLAKDVALLVIDEAHKVLAPTYEAVARLLISDRTQVCGLTATPGRSMTDLGENERLALFFFETKVDIKTPDSEPVIEFLQKQKILSKATYVPLVTNRDYALSDGDLRHLEKFFDLPARFLKTLAADDIRTAEIVKRVQREAEAGHRIIVFACSVDHSKFISSLLKFLGVKSCHIDGEITGGRRAKLIDDFRTGQMSVLCNYGVLSTGFDAPEIDVVCIARPTASVVLYSQMLGRGLRGPAIGGTASCTVIDVIDNISGFSDASKVYDYFKGYFETH